LVGAVLRGVAARESLFGDELSTWWLATTRGPVEIVSSLRHEVELTPPLSFLASWLTTRAGETVELVRAPAVLAGIVAIPLVFELGRRTVGRTAGLIAAALTALSPFMIFYSSEARAYMPMTVLVMMAALALLLAIDGGSRGWWAAYAIAQSAAVYTHYTAVLCLTVLNIWALWTAPHARRAVLIADAAAALLFLSWLGGLRADIDSTDVRIMNALAPFTPEAVKETFERWTIAHPMGLPSTDLTVFPGIVPLAVGGAGLALALAGIVRSGLGRPGARVGLVVALALAAPVGEALVSAVGTNTLIARNLTSSWPWGALAVGAVLASAGGRRLRTCAAALVVAAFAIASIKLLNPGFARPDFRAAAAFVDQTAGPRDTVIDDAVFLLTPGPMTGLDATLRRPHRVIRADAPEQRERSFGFGDPVATRETVVRRAAGSRQILLVIPAQPDSQFAAVWDSLLKTHRYARTSARRLTGMVPLTVLTYERP
jgi:mannosyltransferase